MPIYETSLRPDLFSAAHFQIQGGPLSVIKDEEILVSYIEFLSFSFKSRAFCFSQRHDLAKLWDWGKCQTVHLLQLVVVNYWFLPKFGRKGATLYNYHYCGLAINISFQGLFGHVLVSAKCGFIFNRQLSLYWARSRDECETYSL